MVKKIGTNGNDTIIGTAFADELWGRGGDDTIFGRGGDDYIHGESGGNTLHGEGGNDRVWGGYNADAVWGGDGVDQIYGAAGNDYLVGGLGTDYIHGGSGDDKLRGDDGDDVLNGGGGNDDVRGGAGNDTLVVHERSSDNVYSRTSNYEGGTGNDTLTLDVKGDFVNEFGEEHPWLLMNVSQDRTGWAALTTDPDEGNATQIASHSGIETFRMAESDVQLDFVGSADVTVYGGAEGDRLEGTLGNQTFIGGGGADEYRFLWRDGMNNGTDHVVGFDADEGDLLLFSVNFGMHQNDQLIDISSREANGHTTITLTGVDDGKVYNVIDVDAVGIRWGEDYYIG